MNNKCGYIFEIFYKNFNKSIWWMPRLKRAMKDVVRLR